MLEIAEGVDIAMFHSNVSRETLLEVYLGITVNTIVKTAIFEA
jgi:hypothetical protein